MSVKIRRAVLEAASVEQVPPQAMRFLEDHAVWTEKVLNLEEVQSFLASIIELEGISEEYLPEIAVMVLPYPHASPKSPIAHGSYLPSVNQIRVYPGLASYTELEGMAGTRVKAFHEVISDGNAGALLAQRHIHTVIHELLHVKYGHDEALVEEMSQEYLTKFFSWLKNHMDGPQRLSFGPR
jgi:hypothetical protein